MIAKNTRHVVMGLLDADSIAFAAAFLLGSFARKITGQVLHVDGGASIMGGDLLPMERPEGHVDELAEMVEQGLTLGTPG